MAEECWGDGFSDATDPEPINIVAFTRTRLEDDFQHWLNGNFCTEEDMEFRAELELEYPWLFAKELELDADDQKWVQYEFNCYVNSIYDPVRRI